jgi:hypothetical protein
MRGLGDRSGDCTDRNRRYSGNGEGDFLFNQFRTAGAQPRKPYESSSAVQITAYSYVNLLVSIHPLVQKNFSFLKKEPIRLLK